MSCRFMAGVHNCFYYIHCLLFQHAYKVPEERRRERPGVETEKKQEKSARINIFFCDSFLFVFVLFLYDHSFW